LCLQRATSLILTRERAGLPYLPQPESRDRTDEDSVQSRSCSFSSTAHFICVCVQCRVSQLKKDMVKDRELKPDNERLQWLGNAVRTCPLSIAVNERSDSVDASLRWLLGCGCGQVLTFLTHTAMYHCVSRSACFTPRRPACKGHNRFLIASWLSCVSARSSLRRAPLCRSTRSPSSTRQSSTSSPNTSTSVSQRWRLPLCPFTWLWCT
jgi:hypothetical protein